MLWGLPHTYMSELLTKSHPGPGLPTPERGLTVPQPSPAWAGAQCRGPLGPHHWVLCPGRGSSTLHCPLALGHGDTGRVQESTGAAAPFHVFSGSTALTHHRGRTGRRATATPVSERDPAEEGGGAGQVSVRCPFHLSRWPFGGQGPEPAGTGHPARASKSSNQQDLCWPARGSA